MNAAPLSAAVPPEPLVTVFPDPFVKAWRPGDNPHEPKRSRNPRAPVPIVLPLGEALARVYSTDAHMVAYVAGGHRLLKEHTAGDALFRGDDVERPRGDGVERPATPMTHVLLADVDNPGHAAWDDASFAAWLAWYPTLPVLATCGVYATKSGWRIVQPLEAPVPSTEVERFIAGWHDELREAGVAVDRACRDWTRLFRLPHVWRKTGPFRSPHVALERMGPRTPRPSAPNRSDAGADQAGLPREASAPACL